MHSSKAYLSSSRQNFQLYIILVVNFTMITLFINEECKLSFDSEIIKAGENGCIFYLSISF